MYFLCFFGKPFQQENARKQNGWLGEKDTYQKCIVQNKMKQKRLHSLGFGHFHWIGYLQNQIQPKNLILKVKLFFCVMKTRMM